MPDLMHNAPIRTDLFDGTLDGYQRASQMTAIYPGRGSFWGLLYATVKGGGEVGELQEKVGKLMRDRGLQPDDKINPNDLPLNVSALTEEERRGLALELGDELWYLAAKAYELGFSLSEIAQFNLEKLSSRQQRGTLSGSGDNR